MTQISRLDDVRSLVHRDRLLQTARRLVAIPSPTGEARVVLDDLEAMLREDGFAVQREAATHPAAPAVICRHDTGIPGPCIQFNGHLDVVHLPYVPPSDDGNLLQGSGACDMKGGMAAAIEALRVLRQGEFLKRGSILLVAHDLHEAPWGLGSQLNALIQAGVHGDVVLIPEPLQVNLPIRGRGCATWKVALQRAGPPVHEVARPDNEPSVIAAGAELVQVIRDLDRDLRRQHDPVAGPASAFIGQIHSGEIYNQYPGECMLEGTRRWLPGTDPVQVEAEFRTLVDRVAARHAIRADLEWKPIRGSFALDAAHPFVRCFQQAMTDVCGAPLPEGPKLFVDDGNSFSSLAGIPAITHGPRAGGQHTVNEWVDVDDMVRVAICYAWTASLYLRG